MDITVKTGGLADFDCKILLVGHFEGSKTPEGAAHLLDKKCDGLIGELIEEGDFTGELYSSSVVYTGESIRSRRIMIAGLGKKEEFNLERLRGVFSKAAQKIRDLNITNLAASLDFGEAEFPVRETAQAAVEGAMLGLYRFTRYKTLKKDKESRIDELTIIENPDSSGLEDVREGAETAEIISRAVYCARDLVSTPSTDMTPGILAERAGDIAKERNLKFEALDEPAMKKLGMNALLGVARGSAEEAKLILLEYNGGKKDDRPVVLVGKGITFDSGGISIKPSEKMDEMKSDMSGGAAVIGTIKAAAELKIPLNVVGIIPATENLPGGRAYKPGDILETMSGLTIEVKNTDAEGRLILADALTFAGRYSPAAIIDIATLTGACVVALGDYLTGMMGTDSDLKEKIRNASDTELPLWHEYDELIKSDVADIKNTGGRAGGTITAALLLKRFVNDYPWVHLDIAGPALLSKDKPYIPKGASGVGVRLLIQFLMDRSRASNVSNP
ncbi:MAG: leucyl aminopeptidase [Deltaproteobacteria bacterium]|nr:leucyl aminopeptidase [Deltaproteobacteria bacterium]